jgi:glycosyltransferase involved in cell wall biosynthesis/peptidoglycan/xylan/chitin deacetylase (PgdA/CDA1 family)
VLTHDVEHAAGLAQCGRVMDIEARFGLRSSFNLVPERYAISVADRDAITARGCEVGVHGLNHDGRLFRSRRIFAQRARKINGYLAEWGAAGFRSPAMHHNLDWIQELNVAYDASTFDIDPFEPQPDAAHTIFPFWYAGGPGGGYVELPYTLPQDSTLFLLMGERTIDVWRRKLAWLARHGGMALVIVHPDYMDFGAGAPAPRTYSAALYAEFLECVCTEYAGRYWAALPREVAAFVRGMRRENPAAGARAAPGKRIGVLRHGYYPADVRVSKEVHALAEAGHEVEVICLRDSTEQARGWLDGVRVIRLPHAHRRGGTTRYVWQYALSLATMAWTLSWRACRRPFDWVQVNTMPDALVFAALVARWRGARIMLDMHEPMPELYLTKYGAKSRRLFVRLQIRLEQAALRFADRAMTVNDTIRRRFIERGADGARIAVVRNVPGEGFREIARPAGPRDGFTLLTHGTLQPRYGHDVLLRAVGPLRAEIGGLRVIILGEGESKPHLQHLVEQLGCGECVTFEPPIPFAEMPRALVRADVGVVPLQPGPFSDLCQPNKLFEYIALRIPVVAARFPAIEESFDDTCLAFFEPGNHEDLARAVRLVHDDPDAAGRRAANAYGRYATMKWAVAKAEYVRLF